MDVVAEECRFVTGRSPERGGAGDSSVLTAYGVFQGMRAAAQTIWGETTLRGRRVGIAGMGKVGRHLTGHLLDDGADVVATDVNTEAVTRVTAAYPMIEVVEPGRLVDQPLDVYSPCALGHALTDDVIARLEARIVCEGANNQLDHEGSESLLAERGIVYAPDYVVNAGGVIQVADEAQGAYDEARARAKTAEIFDTTAAILERAAVEGIPPSRAADRLAEERMATAGAGQPLRLPRKR